MMNAFEFNCPMCSRSLVLKTGFATSSWASPYVTVPFECRVEHGDECGWMGCLLLSEGADIAGAAGEQALWEGA